jgi:(4-(4-[2-(gamma-L-glutamylamino)ethyl]phenoxymethyl)furan-2-yl)methanamine synthase
MNVLGLDIGGANLKAARSDDSTRSQSFALWKQPSGLAAALRELTADWTWDRVAVTMTGELCDCFETKRLGVLAILSAVQHVYGDALVWRNDGRFASLTSAQDDPLPCAAANWLALATFAGRYCSAGNGLLIDIGSTTTDIIALRNGKPAPLGRTDTERLKSGELVYTGTHRTPVCTILGLDGMAEFFATTHDVGLILGDIVEDENDCDTADQRPATRENALARLARMVGGDRESMTNIEVEDLAKRVRQRQMDVIGTAISRVIPDIHSCTAIISGVGECLGREAAKNANRVVSLQDILGNEISTAACAYAIAMLASETSTDC